MKKTLRSREDAELLRQLRRATLLQQITVKFRAGFWEASWRGRSRNRCFSRDREEAVSHCLSVCVPPHPKPAKQKCRPAGKKHVDTLMPYHCWYGELEDAA